MTPLPSSFRRAMVLVGLSVGSIALLARGPVASGPVHVQLLAFNDFHGNLDPPAGSGGRIGGVPAGGIEYLATHLARLRAQNPNTLVVSAGDNISASPLLSGLFHDEPAIQALSQAGLDVSSVGNHEFDEGWAELRRMQRGGCHPTDGCATAVPFEGARFEYLAANVRLDPRQVTATTLSQTGWPDTAGETTVLPAYAIRTVGGVRIGFIGLTLQGTAQIVMPSGLRGVTFDDEVTTVNRLVPVLEAAGVHAMVVLIHQGGGQAVSPQDESVNGCVELAGPIVDIVNRLSPAIEVVVSGHTHRAYNCLLGGRLLTSAASYGRVITDIDLDIDPTTDTIVAKHAANIVVTRDVAKDPAETSLLERYRPLYAARAHRVMGALTATIAQIPNAAGESALGDLIADAQLEAGQATAGPGVVAAFMNQGGIRADLVARSTPTSAVTYEDLYTAQPFGNAVVVTTMTGEQIRRLLEQQFSDTGPRGLLQVSRGFSYRYDRGRPAGHRVDRASIRIGNQPLDLGRAYQIVCNEFLAGGGDGFAVFTEATGQVAAGSDLDALAAYFAAHSPVSPPASLTRIVRAEPTAGERRR